MLRQRIKDATEVQSVFGAMSSRPEMARPVCVILDEIDGAMGGSNPNPNPNPNPHPNQAPWEALTLTRALLTPTPTLTQP